METKVGEHVCKCVCQQTHTNVDFIKILEYADIGLKIYKYLANKNVLDARMAPPTPATGTDVFILQNTQDKDLPASTFIQRLDTNKISCPKCKQVIAHAKQLIETISSVNKGNVVAVCDHCRKRAEQHYSCDKCDKISKIFVSSKEDRSKQQRILIVRSQSDLNLKNTRSAVVGPVVADADYVTKSKWDHALLEKQKQFNHERSSSAVALKFGAKTIKPRSERDSQGAKKNFFDCESVEDKKNIYFQDEKDKQVAKSKLKTQIINSRKDSITDEKEKERKMIPLKIRKFVKDIQENTQVLLKHKKEIVQNKPNSDKTEPSHQEKNLDKAKNYALVKVDAGERSNKTEKREIIDGTNQKLAVKIIDKKRLDELKKFGDAEEKNKVKDTKKNESKNTDEKKIKTDKERVKEAKLSKEKVKDVKIVGENGKPKNDKIRMDEQKEQKHISNEKKQSQEEQRTDRTGTQKHKDMKQNMEQKQKGDDSVYQDILKEPKRRREENQNHKQVDIQKQKKERENFEMEKAKNVKATKTEEKEIAHKYKEKREAYHFKKNLNQQPEQEQEEKNMKKVNEEQVKKDKDAMSKTEPPLPFKIDEMLLTKSTKFVTKKTVEITPYKELDIKAIEINRLSNDDLIAKFVKVKPLKKAETQTPKMPEKELQKCLSKIHKSYTDDILKDSLCDICVSSELKELAQKKFLNGKKEVILGNEVKKIYAKDFAKVNEEKLKSPVPALFNTILMTEPTAEADDKKSVNEPPLVDQPSKIKPEHQQQQQQGDQEQKGVIKYALSNRSFIDKGWTLLPTEKVVRKMNIYRMRPARPEFEWFQHNKDKRYLEYDTGEKLAEIDDVGRGRWFYRNGRVALDYYNAEEANAQQRYVIYSSGEPDEHGRTHPYTVLGTFDFLGSGIVFDHGGKIRLKYNQSEGVVLDRSLGPVSHWKWHSLNDPPVLQQVMIDTQMSYKDPEIMKLGDQTDDIQREDNEKMLAIEFDNFIKEKSKKLIQKFKPFQIKMKALKINEQFSLRILDQATIYLLYRDGCTNLKLNLGMLLDHQEIVDTDTAEMGDVVNNIENLPARTDSIAALQANIDKAKNEARFRLERSWRLCPPVPRCSVDRLHAAASRPVRKPIVPAPSSSGFLTAAERYCINKKPPYNNNLYYNN